MSRVSNWSRVTCNVRTSPLAVPLLVLGYVTSQLLQVDTLLKRRLIGVGTLNRNARDKYRAIKLICNRVIHESEIVCRYLYFTFQKKKPA
jgi:hypothetical protein